MVNLLDIETRWGDQFRVAGERKMLLRLLTLMFDDVPPAMVDRINAISDEATLAQVAEQIVTIQTIDELILPEVNA